MTAVEMKDEFLTRYDAATSLAAPGWEDLEISNFLNIGQLRLVKEKFETKDYNPISNLIITDAAACSTHTLITTNAYTLNINTTHPTFLYYLRSRTKLTRTNPVITDDWIPNDAPGNKTDIDIFLTTAFNRPWFKYPKAFTEVDDGESVLTVLVDYYTTAVSEIELTAIIEPDTIDITTTTNTNLDLVLHPLIVEYAVEEALKSIKFAKISNQ